MKKYILIAFIVLSLGVATPARAMHLEQPTREEIMIQLISTLMELVKQLQAQLQIALAKENRVVPPVTVSGAVSTPVVPLTVSISGKASDNHYSLGGNCEMVVFLVSEPANVYNSETKSWSIVIDRFFFRPQATSTRIDFVFTSGDKRVDTWLDVGEAIDRSAMTGQEFDYQLGKCK